MPDSLLTATLRDLQTVVDSLLADTGVASRCSATAILGLREIRICARLLAQGPPSLLMARQMDAAAERLGLAEPSLLRDVALAAHHLASYILQTGSLADRRHILEARITLRRQRALRGDTSGLQPPTGLLSKQPEKPRE